MGFLLNQPTSAKWPVGTDSIRTSDLSAHLTKRAGWYARRALNNYASHNVDQLLDAAVGIGCSTEMLAKAYLVAINPAMIEQSQGDLVTKLWLTDSEGNVTNEKTKGNPTTIKTITASGSLNVIGKISKEFPYVDKDIIVFGVRNSAMHLGLVDKGDMENAILAMVKLNDAILQLGAAISTKRQPATNPVRRGKRHEVRVSRHMRPRASAPSMQPADPFNRQTFYGGLAGTADALVAKEYARLSALIAPKRAAAMHLFASRKKAGVDFDALFLDIVTPRGQDSSPVVCPICDSLGKIFMQTTVVPYTVTTSEGATYHRQEFISTTTEFYCNACEISLTPEEIALYPKIPPRLVEDH